MPPCGLVFDLLNSSPGRGNTSSDDADSSSSGSDYSFPDDFAADYWSDSSDSIVTGYIFRGRRRINRKTVHPKFDSDDLSKFLQDHNLKLVFRSSERVAEGFRISHNDKLVTVFSGADFESEDKSAVVNISETLSYDFDVSGDIFQCHTITSNQEKGLATLRARRPVGYFRRVRYVFGHDLIQSVIWVRGDEDTVVALAAVDSKPHICQVQNTTSNVLLWQMTSITETSGARYKE